MQYGDSRRWPGTAGPVLLLLAALGVGGSVELRAHAVQEGTVEPGRAVSALGDPSSTDALDRHLHRLVPFGFSGAVLVVEGGVRVHAAGYGRTDPQSERATTTETVFDVGSLSKQFTAAAVLKLEERGRLSVDDPIGDHLPGVSTDKRDVTIHQLLTHTSGLPAFHDTAGDYQAMTREEAERAILGADLRFAPGEDWAYSNSGYTLLAAIVERVSGRPFAAFLADELFGPAGLERTGLPFEARFEDRPVAHGYRGSEDLGSPTSRADTDELWALIGNGGVLCSLDDLARWDRALREGTVLSHGSVERLFSPHARVREGLHYGYGWYVEEGDEGETVLRHGGASDFGFAARWRRHVQRDLFVVVLVNRQPPGMDVSFAADAVRAAVEDLALEGYEGPASERVEVPPETVQVDEDLQRYAGHYVFEDGSLVSIAAAGDALRVEPQGPEAVRHLAFPAVSEEELNALGRLDRLADEILNGVTRDDYRALGRLLADSSRLDAYRDFVSGWWTEFQEDGGGPDDVETVGTVPMWWSPGDDRLATLIRATLDDRTQVFRLHWREGRVVGLGGGAIREPATTLFAPAEGGGFVGYHLGIRRPVDLSFQTADSGEVAGLRLETRGGTAVARRARGMIGPHDARARTQRYGS